LEEVEEPVVLICSRRKSRRKSVFFAVARERQENAR
jgi:hypothetical protein